MADFTSTKQSLIASMSSPSGSSSAAPADDDFEDACSICLEPFSLDDPSTATSCKHEYHLQCILEWSQRSKECPICWQSLALMDPTSQELLAAVDMERNAQKRHVSINRFAYPRHYQESDSEYASQWTNDPDLNECLMHQLAAAMSRARKSHRKERQRSSEGSLPVHMFPSCVSFSTLYPNPAVECSSANGSDGGSSPTSSVSAIDSPSALSSSPSFVSLSPGSVPKRDNHFPSRPFKSQSSDFTQKLRSSELLSFSESVKSRISAASARYKDSISKGTQGFKEKFLAHNSSVKELSKGVQREMNASIAGVARLIERLDLKSKQNSDTGEGHSSAEETSGFFSKGKGVLDNIIAKSCENRVVNERGLVSSDQSRATGSIPSGKDVCHEEGGY